MCLLMVLDIMTASLVAGEHRLAERMVEMAVRLFTVRSSCAWSMPSVDLVTPRVLKSRGGSPGCQGVIGTDSGDHG